MPKITVIKKLLFFLGFTLLVIGTIFWINIFYFSLHDYNEYCELASQEFKNPLPYHAWSSGRFVNITLIVLFFAWIPFLDYTLRQHAYPFLKRKLTYRELKFFSRSTSTSLHDGIYGLVLGYFTRVNRRIRAKIGLWGMKLETFEHVNLLIKVFKWIVIPSSFLYICAEFYFFGQIVLDSAFFSILLFFYSNFVPDLPAIFRRRIYRDEREAMHKKLPRYKTYALLLFAPLFIFLLFCGIEIEWRTTETFHNFKSLAVYGGFIFTISLLVLLAFPISIGRIIEAFYVPLYAILGYLTHLKVDLLF